MGRGSEPSLTSREQFYKKNASEPSQRRPREHRTSHLGGAVGLLLDGGSA